MRPVTQRAAAVTTIGPRDIGSADVSALIQYREVLYFLILRTVKVRYRQTVVGITWVVIQPLALMALFSIVLGRVAGLAQSSVPYAAFAIAGLVPWLFVSQAVLSSSASLVDSANLLQKAYFPRVLLPFASIGASAVDLLASMAVLSVASTWLGFGPTSSWVVLLPLLVYLLMIATGLGVFLSALNVRFRDVRHALPFLVQLWFFASPILYDSRLVPEQLRVLYDLNPMVTIVEGFRYALLGQPLSISGPEVVGSLAITVVGLIIAVLYFASVERIFADIV